MITFCFSLTRDIFFDAGLQQRCFLRTGLNHFNQFLCNVFSILFCRARQRCFWLLAFISRPQVRNIHLPERMILPGSIIPSDKYFLKNLTFVVRNPLVWLRHHSSQTLYVARVKSIQVKKGVSFLAYRTGSHDDFL